MSRNSNDTGISKSVVPRLPSFSDDFNESRLKRKIREQPLVPIGMAGFFAIVAYNAYKIITKKKSDLPLQLRIIHTRMYAQGFVISLLTAGMIYSTGSHYYNNYYKNKDEDKKMDGQQQQDLNELNSVKR